MPRADARRNRERLLAAAKDAFAADGPETSLDGIARRAGLGSGTLYRHFPTREALMRAVYWAEVESLCAVARELLEKPEPADALMAWLRQLVGITSRRGLAAVLLPSVRDAPSQFKADCHAAIRAAAAPLLSRAQSAGALRADVTLADLMELTHAIALVTELEEGEADRAERFLSLLMDGLRSST